MRVMVFGAMHMVGKSAKTGAAYDMSRLYVASDLVSKTTDAYKRVGTGFEAAEVECEPSVVEAFIAKQQRFPAVLDLVTDMRMQGGKLVPVVTGLAEVVDKRAA